MVVVLTQGQSPKKKTLDNVKKIQSHEVLMSMQSNKTRTKGNCGK